MQDFFDSTRLGLNHVQVIVRGMFAVAKSDDVHPAEQVMIRGFYESCQSEADGIADYDDLVRRELTPAEAAEILDTVELREVFLKSCLFLAFADGTYSDAEREVVRRYAEGFGMDDAMLEQMKTQVTDHLLQQIARVQNIDALREVASELWKS